MKLAMIVAVVVAFMSANSLAAPFPVARGDFSSTAIRITYAEAVDAQPVNGVTFEGVLHEYSRNGVPDYEGAIFSTLPAPGLAAPLVIGNVAPPQDGVTMQAVLSLTLPDPVNRFAFDFVMNIEATLPDAVSVRVFDPADVFLGELLFGATIIPNFTGTATKGFAGVGNLVPFSRVELRFNDTLPMGPGVPHPGDRIFAIDNLRFEAALPEPSSVALIVATVTMLGVMRAR